MPNADLVDVLTRAAIGLINADMTGTVDGESVAAAVGRSPHDAEVYWAFQEIRRRGDLSLDAWRGGMGLPGFVRLP
jgi:hypothetical protein